MAENGINGHQSGRVQWRVGLMNFKGKYLTAETFGYEVNASGAALKKKQIWVLEQDPTDDSVYIRSSQERYMKSDKYGKVSVDVEPDDKSDNEKFKVEYSPDGKWAFKHVNFGNYLCGVDGEVKCFDKSPCEKNWWSIQLYAHPQIHLRNVNRKRYVHLNKDTEQLECTEVTPWGSDALLLLNFEGGKYTLKSCDNRYLSCDGSLEDDVSDNTKYCLEVHSEAVGFKDCNGRYLAGLGQGTVKGKAISKISKDELFTIEESHPQCVIISHNGDKSKSVSVKQGQDVSANQPLEEFEDTQIFQLENKKGSSLWAFRACTNKYWSLQDSGTVQAKQAEATDKCFFELEWQSDGTVGIKGPDGKYLSYKQTGILFSSGQTFDEAINKFRIVIVNRPLLILKSEFGFVGTNVKNTQYICNKSTYDIVKVTYDGDLSYTITDKDGMNWCVKDDNMVYLDKECSSKFQFQFCGNSMMAIRAPNGCYLSGEQNGLFKATAEQITSTSQWEF